MTRRRRFARDMDSFGDEATYRWEFEGRKLRVDEGDGESGAYFEAWFDDDFSQYAGTWHGFGAAGDADDGLITYTRVD